MRKEVTIYDLASELNVSPSTVSRALKDHFSIGLVTKKKIVQLAAEKGYRRELTKKWCSIGVMVSDMSQPLVPALLGGIEDVANENGFSVIISQSRNKLRNEVRLVKSLSLAGVTGLIVLLANETKDIEHFNRFVSRNIPVVFVDTVMKGLSAGHVIVDYFEAAYQATSHLIHQGCRRIAFMGRSGADRVYEEKLRGYLEALKDHQIYGDQRLVVKGDRMGAKEAAYGAMDLLDMHEPPQAIFCDNDEAGVGVIQYARMRGLSVPHDLAVVGFNNDAVSMMIDPPLSTLAHPSIEMGKAAAREILTSDRSSEMPVRKIVLKANLIVRQSSLRSQL